MKPTTFQGGQARFALVAAMYKHQLGEVIRARREELGMSQKDLAHRANVEEPQTVSRWERGINAPTDLESVARALEMTADELLRQLRPINQKERRRFSSDGATQLDRIEAKVDEVLRMLRVDPAAFDAATADDGVADIVAAAAGPMEVLGGATPAKPPAKKAHARKRRAS